MKKIRRYYNYYVIIHNINNCVWHFTFDDIINSRTGRIIKFNYFGFLLDKKIKNEK